MFLIPAQLVSAVTFPGVIVHEAAHLLFCKLRRVAVFKVCFFRFGNPAGYVIHEETDNFTSAFLISFGPFFINSALCILICLPALAPMRLFGLDQPLSYLLMWLGISIGAHAFPSTHDAQCVWRLAKREARKMNALALLSLPMVGLFILGNLLSVIWFDVIYAFGIGFALPAWLFEALS
ncbi:MAG TPA: metalloprotease family protein [Thermoanaerobaculia bacterium]|nr:metalloprotease family protein [Thermoanaerobaculia bacterium]